MDDVAKLTVSVPEAAKILGFSRNTAYMLSNDGTLPALRLGRRLVVPVKALEAMIEQAMAGKAA